MPHFEQPLSVRLFQGAQDAQQTTANIITAKNFTSFMILLLVCKKSLTRDVSTPGFVLPWFFLSKFYVQNHCIKRAVLENRSKKLFSKKDQPL